MKDTTPEQSGAKSPWHKGELALQERAGVASVMAQVGAKVIRPIMPQQHRDFYHQLAYLLIATVDERGLPWASYLCEKPGFVTSKWDTQLTIKTLLATHDPAYQGLYLGAAIGLLGIEPHSRRRNRVNGVIEAIDDSGFDIVVQQSMGNCPKYIHRQVAKQPERRENAQRIEERTALSAEDKALISQADTCYVASYYSDDLGRQVDVSHRGGEPGFIAIDDDGHLAIPDFAGNRFFCTLGNILVTGVAGLTFSDSASGDLVQLSGRAYLGEPGEEERYQGAQRVWHVIPQRVIRRSGMLPFQNVMQEQSPYVQGLGPWL